MSSVSIFDTKEDIDKIIQTINDALPMLNNLKTSYSECVSTLSRDISSLDYGSWEDDVQKKIKVRTDSFKLDVDKISSSVDSEHLPVLIRKLTDLEKELQTIKKKKAINERYENLTHAKDEWKYDEEKKEFYIIIDGNRYNHDSFDSLCRRSWNQIHPYVDNANKIIEYISSICFGTPIDASTESYNISSEETFESNDEKEEQTNAESTVISSNEIACFTNNIGINYTVTMSVSEENGYNIQTRTTNIVYPNGEESVVTFQIITDNNDPRNKKVITENGDVFETKVGEDGQIYAFEDGEWGEDPIEVDNYTLKIIDNNTNEQISESLTFNNNSPVDKQILRLMCDNAALRENRPLGELYNASVDLINGGESYDVYDFGSGSEGLTITYTPSE